MNISSMSGFQEKVLMRQINKAAGDDGLTNRASLFTYSSLYLYQLTQLRNSLMMAEQLKFTQSLDRYRINRKQVSSKLEFGANRIFKAPTKVSVFKKPDYVRPQHPSQLPPLTTCVQGQGISTEINLNKTKCRPIKKHLQKAKSTIKAKSRDPTQRKPTIPSLERKTRNHEHDAALDQKSLQTSRKGTSRISARTRLRPVSIQDCPRSQSEPPHLESVDEGSGININIWNEYLVFYENSESNVLEEKSLTLSTVLKHVPTASTLRSQNKSLKHNKLSKSPLRLPKLSDSAMSNKAPLSVRHTSMKPEHIPSDTENTNGNISKMHIVVDMPNIILNCASPVPEESRHDTPVGLLRKACIQSDLRQKEIKNLLEDVRELNIHSQYVKDRHMTLTNSDIANTTSDDINNKTS